MIVVYVVDGDSPRSRGHRVIAVKRLQTKKKKALVRIDTALLLGQDYLATGHYASRTGSEAVKLVKPQDSNDDQSLTIGTPPATCHRPHWLSTTSRHWRVWSWMPVFHNSKLQLRRTRRVWAFAFVNDISVGSVSVNG